MFASFVVIALAAQDWSRFRGPEGAGVAEAGVDVQGFEELWDHPVPGTGHSSPVVHGGRLWVTGRSDTENQRLVIAYKALDGTIVWTHESPFLPHAQHKLNSFASSTPAVSDEGVFVAWTNGETLEVVALDHHGKQVWKKNLGPWVAEHGGGASPIVVGESLIVAKDHEGESGFVCALHVDDGREIWRRDRKQGKAAYSTPLVYQGDAGGQLIFTSSAHGMSALDPGSGELLWELSDVFKDRCVGSPIAVNGLVFATAGMGDGGKQAVLVRPGSAQEPGRVTGELRRGLPYVPTAVASRDRLYLWNDAGIVSCVDSKTLETLWQERVEGRFFASPILVGRLLVNVSMDGELVVLRAEDDFSAVQRIALPEGTQASAAFSVDTLFVRTPSRLLAFRALPQESASKN